MGPLFWAAPFVTALQRRKTLIAVALALLVASATVAQTTSTLTGTVTTGGGPLPGVTVTISSPALLGVRTTVSGPNGDYSFPGLPPGQYSVRFELQGLQTLTKRAELRLAETARADADLRVAESVSRRLRQPSA
jgi:hypothetical protein